MAVKSTLVNSAVAHIFDYSTEVEEKEKANDGYLGHANRTSFLVSQVQKGRHVALE